MTESALPLTSDEITVEWLNAVLSESDAFQGATIRSFEREVIGEGVGFAAEFQPG